MIIPTVVFTQNDIGKEPNEFTQDKIVSCLTARELNILMCVDLALYKIDDDNYVIIKCIEGDLVNWKVHRDMALKLLKQFTTGRIL